jgi:hypothetical protein
MHHKPFFLAESNRKQFMTEELSTYQRLQNELSRSDPKCSQRRKTALRTQLAENWVSLGQLCARLCALSKARACSSASKVWVPFVVGPKQVIESGLEVLESIETQAEKIGLDVTMGELRSPT